MGASDSPLEIGDCPAVPMARGVSGKKERAVPPGKDADVSPWSRIHRVSRASAAQTVSGATARPHKVQCRSTFCPLAHPRL